MYFLLFIATTRWSGLCSPPEHNARELRAGMVPADGKGPRGNLSFPNRGRTGVRGARMPRHQDT